MTPTKFSKIDIPEKKNEPIACCRLLFYGSRFGSGYAQVMRAAVALNGSFFNAQRMMFQYLKNAYADDEMP